jgi:hypothetical protein
MKAGIDDYLAHSGPDAALDLIAAAKPAPAPAPADEPNHTEKFAALLTGCEFFKNPEGKLFADLQIQRHTETWSLRSPAFRSWLSYQYRQQYKTMPPNQQLQSLLMDCEGRAQFDGRTMDVHVRVAGAGGRIYLDMGDPDWHAIEIAADGWRVVAEPPVRFRRPPGLLPLPWPTPNGSLMELQQFLNVGEGDSAHEIWVALLSWLIGSLNPEGPYPLLILQGEQGSAKSTQARLLRTLIDPSVALVRSAPKEERDLVIAAHNAWVISIDNLSSLPHWLSDALCRISTGGGFATRQLHTDSEEILFNSMRPMILNGIDDVVQNGDLADRSLTVYLPTIPETRRQTEKEFYAAFYEAQPRILGGLLTAVSGALRCVGNVQLERLPRMADFARFVSAAASSGAVAFSQSGFEKFYEAQHQRAAATLVESNPLTPAIRKLLSDRPSWIGTATELLEALNAVATDDVKRRRAWPENAKQISNRLRRIAPGLRIFGIYAGFTRDTSSSQGTRLIELIKKGSE